MNFSHLDSEGNPNMVDISHKSATKRQAVARSIVYLGPNILNQLEEGEIHTSKGPVFQTAILAGTMGVKQTGYLIPLCHPLLIEHIHLDISLTPEKEVLITCTVGTTGKTGVEMEALTGATIAALTLYDMCKALSHNIVIKDTRLIEKTGGKSDFKSY